MNEFDDVIRLLRENRPEATELELDQIKRRVYRRAARPSRRRHDMKSRIAILATLVLGMVLSTAGAGMAIQGLSQSNDASIAQYGGVAGEEDEAQRDRETVGGGGAPGGVAGEQDALQPTRQAETGADGGELPFTGFLAIPVLIGGVALLTTGAVLRRRTADDPS